MAFRSDSNDTKHCNNYIPATRDVIVRINDRLLHPNERHWNRRHLPEGDAIDALQELDFDVLSIELLSTYHGAHQNTIEVQLYLS